MVATICASVLSAVNAGITKRLLPVGEVSLTHYQASLDPYDEAEARIELDAATAGAQLDPVSEDEHIAGVNDFNGLVLNPFPSLAHVGDPFAKPSVALVGIAHPGGLPLARGVVLQVGREPHEHQLEVSTHEGAPARQRTYAAAEHVEGVSAAAGAESLAKAQHMRP